MEVLKSSKEGKPQRMGPIFMGELPTLDTKFLVSYLALFCLFSKIDGFECFWMGSPYKKIQLRIH